jgi:protein-tyrosine kinase
VRCEHYRKGPEVGSQAVLGQGPQSNAEDAASSTPQELLRRGEDFVTGADDRPAEAAVTDVEREVADAAAQARATEPAAPVESTAKPDVASAATTARAPRVELPLAELREKGFLSPHSPRSRIAEEFRGIKRPILRNIAGKGDKASQYANLVMVTSALQGDGKTFSSINLALSIAMEQDKTVLFVDADVVRATAGKTSGIPKTTPG